MGKGAPVKIESMPESLVIKVVVAEGEFYSAYRILQSAFKNIRSDQESPANWSRLNIAKEEFERRSREYMYALSNLEKHMGRI